MRLLTAQLEDGSYHADALFTGWEFHFGEATAQLPREITALAPGSHHSVATGDFIYQVEVGEWDGRPAYLTYDVTEWENQEHAVLCMLLYGLLLVLVVAIGMGLTAIRAILAPVQTLSERLTQIEPGQASLRLAADYVGTEIGQIAASFDKYQERLEKFVERERSFTAAASHELRTPLAVMMGALDVLSANPQSPASQRALERISRACAEMLAFIEATLLLSREESNQIDQGAAADVVALVERTLDDHAAQIAERSLVIVRDYIGTPVLAQPASLVQITVGNLLRNAIEHTRDGRIKIRIEDSLIAISDTGKAFLPTNSHRCLIAATVPRRAEQAWGSTWSNGSAIASTGPSRLIAHPATERSPPCDSNNEKGESLARNRAIHAKENSNATTPTFLHRADQYKSFGADRLCHGTGSDCRCADH
ncbi:MAG: HAMP domain-containing histidine kinase [Haliea sp.]|nr:HAMP domain-containing histidine kinase [Haliea sp.]